MNSKLQTCPNPQSLADFLLGKLPQEEVETYEFHLAECSPCSETVRAMNVHDTLDELAKGAFGAKEAGDSSFVEIADQAAVRDLVGRMKQLGSPDDLRQRVEIEETTPMEARAAEVQRLLLPCDDKEAIGQLAHYRVKRLLGAGSTGVVYLAEDENLNRKVALKILRPSLGHAARERFVAEARATAAIEDPNVVSIYHVGNEDSLAYIAMQWSPGETLEQRLARENTLPAQEVRLIGKQVASGLAAAHQIGLIHRDIKPANVWLEEETSNVKILDFGLVRATDEDPQLTCTGMIAGTPCYMSPEQSRGAELDCRSDFFSLGCLLYESLTGQLPFCSTNVLATLQSIQRDAPATPSELEPGVPQDLSTLVMCLLEKSAAKRPPTADSIANAVVRPRSDWSFEPAFQCAAPQTDASGGKANSRSRGKSSFPRFGWLTGLSVCVLLMFGGFMYPQIIRIATNQGELAIETNDPDVKIEVVDEGGRVRIVDLKTEQSIDIVAGKYEIRPHSDENSIDIDKHSILMKRGGKEIVRVTRDKSPQGLAESLETPADAFQKYWNPFRRESGETESGETNQVSNDEVDDSNREIARLEQLSFSLQHAYQLLQDEVWANDPFLNGLSQFLGVAESKIRWYQAIRNDVPLEDLSDEMQWLKDFNDRLTDRVQQAELRVQRIAALAQDSSQLSNRYGPNHTKLQRLTRELKQLGYRFQQPNDKHSSISLSDIVGRTTDEDEIRRAIAQFRVAAMETQPKLNAAKNRLGATHHKVRQLQRKADEYELSLAQSLLQLKQYKLDAKEAQLEISNPIRSDSLHGEAVGNSNRYDPGVSGEVAAQSSDNYIIDAGDVLGVFVDGVLGAGMPEVHLPEEGSDLPPSVGFPVLVMADGKISLPNIEPILVKGKSINETLDLLKAAYLGGEDPILKPNSRISVTLMRKRVPQQVNANTKNENWSDDYQLNSGDVLGVFVDGVLGDGMPEVHLPEEGSDLPPSVGFPVLVMADGKISLPNIEPILVKGKSINETLDLLKAAYLGGDDPILKPNGRISVTLMRKRMLKQVNANTKNENWSDDYKLNSGDVIGVYVDGVFRQKSQHEDLTYEGETSFSPTSFPNGFPWMVGADGKISLPRVEPIEVRGKNVTETLELVKAAYLGGKQPILQPKSRIRVTLLKKRPVLDQVMSINTPVVDFAPSQPSQIQVCIKQLKTEAAAISGRFVSDHPEVIALRREIKNWENFLADSLDSENEVIRHKSELYDAFAKEIGTDGKRTVELRHEILELLKGQFVYDLSLIFKETDTPSSLKPEESIVWQRENNPELQSKLIELLEQFEARDVANKLPDDHPASITTRNRISVIKAILTGMESEPPAPIDLSNQETIR